ncbi:hypothetical protein GGX14DRAFT_563046 [Mycena pura]|uniref:Uncharacterized protein n=1 Tax=Mycena pura TaxID=153505 RepID=A0AAD6VJV6_9AGAR|nr:hypothetical protein GGX14DRAFT_563046 [Mycena pura]
MPCWGQRDFPSDTRNIWGRAEPLMDLPLLVLVQSIDSNRVLIDDTRNIWGRAEPLMDLPLLVLVQSIDSNRVLIDALARFLYALSATYIFLSAFLIKCRLLRLCAWTPACTPAHFMLGFVRLTLLLLHRHAARSMFRFFLNQGCCTWATPRCFFIPFVVDIVADSRTIATDTRSICNVIWMRAGIRDTYGYGMAEVVGAYLAQANFLVPVLAGIWKMAVWKGVPIFLPRVFLLRVHRRSPTISRVMSGACTGGNDNGNRGLTAVGAADGT